MIERHPLFAEELVKTLHLRIALRDRFIKVRRAILAADALDVVRNEYSVECTVLPFRRRA